jgi:hypothetical protein
VNIQEGGKKKERKKERKSGNLADSEAIIYTAQANLARDSLRRCEKIYPNMNKLNEILLTFGTLLEPWCTLIESQPDTLLDILIDRTQRNTREYVGTFWYM